MGGVTLVEAFDRFRLDKQMTITFKAPASLVELMNKAARVLGVSRSELIRDAVYAYIATHTPELLYPELREIVEWPPQPSSGTGSLHA